jgi:hypothetical protein
MTNKDNTETDEMTPMNGWSTWWDNAPKAMKFLVVAGLTLLTIPVFALFGYENPEPTPSRVTIDWCSNPGEVQLFDPCK